MSEFLLLLLIIPTVTSAIGWFTNLVAVRMIFYPREFIGVGPLGWQGILPRHSSRFAAGVAETITEHLISAREMAERLDPEEMEEQLGQIIDEELPEICRRAANAMQDGIWEQVPEPLQVAIIGQVRRGNQEVIHTLFDELTGISDELLPLKPLIEEKLSGKNVGNLVKLFQKAGSEEFKFIEIYGGVFGLMIGFLQVALWSWLQQWWLMPLIGIIVGTLTNWLAIQMIFRPLEPKRFFGLITYQGMFPRRQVEISAEYGRVVSKDVLSIRNLFRLLTQGEAGMRVAALVTKTMEDSLNKQLDALGQLMPIQDTPEVRAKVKSTVIDCVLERAPERQPELESFLAKRLDIANTLETRLSQLPKSKFERVLRGVFEEDELTLILCGGFLGGVVGAAQAVFLLAM